MLDLELMIHFTFLIYIAYILYKWELQIHIRKKILDLGHELSKTLYDRYKKLSPTYIYLINMFYSVIVITIIPILLISNKTSIYISRYIFGLFLRCVMGTLTQMPCPIENSQFSTGELGGFGSNRSMIWIFSGHCFTISSAIIILWNIQFYKLSILYCFFNISLILWYLGTRAHYSIDMFIGTLLPFYILN